MKYLKIVTTIIIILTIASLATKAQGVMFEYDAAGNMIKRSPDVVCYTSLTVNTNARNNTKLLSLYASSGTIKTQTLNISGTDVVVRKNEEVDFRADKITLQEGFSVESDASFNAKIDPCEQ